MKYKLTVIFRGSKQVGFETWTDYATTCNIPLTKEQEQLLASEVRKETAKEFANIVISECEHLQEHCQDMNNNDAYDYVEILIAEINKQAEQYGKED